MNWEEEQRQRALANQREREADAERKRAEAGQSVSSVQGDQISRKIKQINEDKKETQAQPTFVVGKAVLGAKGPPGIAAGPETPASTQIPLSLGHARRSARFLLSFLRHHPRHAP
jgi:hypothetical protein